MPFQHVATNELLYVVANTCRRLTLLDISYSDKVPFLLLFRFFSFVLLHYLKNYHQVTDIGLVHLCGVLSGTSRTLQVSGYFTILQL